jgi:hypothetical protein
MKGGGPPPRIKNYTQKVSVAPAFPTSDSCDLRFTATLIDIQPALLGVNTGNFLRIIPVTGGLLGAFDTADQLCGYLDSAYDRDLLNCISLGNRYKGRLRHDRKSVDVQKIR